MAHIITACRQTSVQIDIAAFNRPSAYLSVFIHACRQIFRLHRTAKILLRQDLLTAFRLPDPFRRFRFCGMRTGGIRSGIPLCRHCHARHLDPDPAFSRCPHGLLNIFRQIMRVQVCQILLISYEWIHAKRMKTDRCESMPRCKTDQIFHIADILPHQHTVQILPQIRSRAVQSGKIGCEIIK